MSNLGNQQLGGIILGASSIPAGYGQAQAFIARHTRISQIPVEVLISPTSQQARISQIPVEILILPTDVKARISQVAVEILILPILQEYGQAQATIDAPIFIGTGQTQARIIQVYNASAQAQAEIREIFTGQANASIKQIYTLWGQAQATIEVTYHAHSQAQGTILQIYYVYAQAQAQLGSLYLVHGQAQAVILQTSVAHGQANAQILQTYYAHGQANALILYTYSIHAQAESFILVEVAPAHGQAQAQIKRTYRGHGQARARILAARRFIAQAKTAIKKTGAAKKGQAQALLVSSVYNVYAQSEALIDSESKVQSGNAFALIISASYLHVDTFSRIESGQFGTPDIGSYQAAYFPEDEQDIEIDGSRLTLTDAGSYVYIAGYADINEEDVIVTLDYVHRPSGYVQLYARYSGSPDFDSVYANNNSLNQWQIAANGTSFVLGTLVPMEQYVGETYRVKLVTKGTFVGLKVWPVNEPEPEEWLTTLYNVARNGGGEAGFYIDSSVVGTQYADNFFVTLTPNEQHGQAQAFILAPSPLVYGQAEAYIRLQVGYGQAQALIKVVYFKSSQSQAFIVTTRPVAQANARIKIVGIGNVAQSIAHIRRVRRNLAQAIGTIFVWHIAYPSGQAQAFIENGIKHGQARAFIRSPLKRSGNARAYIFNLNGWAHAQSRAFIRMSIGHGQAGARIKLLSTNATNIYQRMVVEDGAAAYYPLNEPLPGIGTSPVTPTPLVNDKAFDNIGTYDLTREYAINGRGPYGGYGGIPGTYGDNAILSRVIDEGFNYLFRYNQPIPITSATFTIEFWVKFLDTDPITSTTYVLHVGQPEPHNTGAITVIRQSTGQLQVAITSLLYGNVVVNNNEWIHVVITRTGGIFSVYYNNTLVGFSAFASPNLANTVFVHADGGNTLSYKFTLDELALYTSSLSDTLVREHYTVGLGNPQPGQARARIKQVESKVGQAQASVWRHEGLGQSNAHISTTAPSGQAQTYIMLINRVLGQAQATLAERFYVDGQAQARITGFNTSSGQSMAYVDGIFYILLDTFTRTTSLGDIGVPDIGPAYVPQDNTLYDSEFTNSLVDGNYLITSGAEEFTWINAKSPIYTKDINVYLDTKVSSVEDWMTVAEITVRRTFMGNGVSLSIYYEPNIGDMRIYFYNGSSAETYIPKISANIWYTTRFYAVDNEIKAKFWPSDEEEPGVWLLEDTINAGGFLNRESPGGVAFYSDTGENTSTVSIEHDNFIVLSNTYLPYPQTYSGNALATIRLNNLRRLGQAQARIKGTMAHGLSRTAINRTYRAHGLTRARIGIGVFTPTAQTQALIREGIEATGLARALIEKARLLGQAQAKINSFEQKISGQSNARIFAITLYNSFAQAMAQIKGPAIGQAAALIGGAKYVVRYNGYDLPGYAQQESINSVSRLQINGATYLDGAVSEYLGLENKLVSLRMKTVGSTYIDVKLQTQKAATIVRSSQSFTKLYIQYWDRYFEALSKSITIEKTVRESMRMLDYVVEFETKPWLTSDKIHIISGTGTINTDSVARTLDNGGWTPAHVIVDGTDITVSGYTESGEFAGFISISGAVSNFEIDSKQYTSTDNTYMNNADYTLYVGPGKTYFVIAGATNCVISWQDRWYL